MSINILFLPDISILQEYGNMCACEKQPSASPTLHTTLPSARTSFVPFLCTKVLKLFCGHAANYVTSCKHNKLLGSCADARAGGPLWVNKPTQSNTPSPTPSTLTLWWRCSLARETFSDVHVTKRPEGVGQVRGGVQLEEDVRKCVNERALEWVESPICKRGRRESTGPRPRRPPRRPSLVVSAEAESRCDDLSNRKNAPGRVDETVNHKLGKIKTETAQA